MAKTIQFKRGTTAQTNLFVGALGEVTVDTDKDVVVVHDGTTQGGFAQAAKANTDGSVSVINKTGTTLATVSSANGLVVNKTDLTDIGTDASPALQIGAQNTGLYVDSSGNLSATVNGGVKFKVESTGGKQSTIEYTTTLYKEYQIRAWARFNGSGVVSVVGGGNVSSVTDVGVGKYTVNMFQAMPDTGYATLVTVGTSAQTPNNSENDSKPYSFIDSTSAFTVCCMNDADGFIDFASIYVAVVR